jgi:dTDP-4-dehydrorhamnose reductase
MKRILITGSNGLLGQKTAEVFSRSDYPLLLTSAEDGSVFDEQSLPYRKLDITRRQDVRSVVDEFEPAVIINTAAVTDVDGCEANRESAWQVNAGGVENLAIAAKFVGATVIQISTDYVFDGRSGPYSESDRPNPLSYYGRTKLASENILKTSGIPAACIRTMVLYGNGLEVKPNFALWLVRTLSDGKQVRVVTDQIGTPTLADDVAFAILKIVELGRTGLYHVAGPDLVSRYEFAQTAARVFDLDQRLIVPVKTGSMKQAAPRPLKSGLLTLKAQIELDCKLSGPEHGLTVLKNQLDALKQQ